MWISVEDELPDFTFVSPKGKSKSSAPILLYRNTNLFGPQYIVAYRKKFYNYEYWECKNFDYSFSVCEFTHWQPITPPEE